MLLHEAPDPHTTLGPRARNALAEACARLRHEAASLWDAPAPEAPWTRGETAALAMVGAVATVMGALGMWAITATTGYGRRRSRPVSAH